MVDSSERNSPTPTPGDKGYQGFGWALVRQAAQRPYRFFFLLAGLFSSPALLGYAFLPISYLSLTPLWYDPSTVVQNYDLYDAVIYFAPADSLLRSELLQGRFPFWNPYNLGGHPIAFNGQTGMFYPVKLLLLCLFPVWVASAVSQWLHLAAAGCGAYALGRKLKLGDESSLFLGLGWFLNPFLASWMELGSIQLCAAWTPWLVLSALRARESWKAVPLMGFCLAMLAVSSHLQFVVHFALFGAIVGLRLAGAWTLKQSLRFSVGIGLGLGFAAPYLIPSAILMSDAQRPVMSREFLQETYRQFLSSAPGTAIFPDLYGNPASAYAEGRIFGAGNFIYSETVLYMGVTVLVMALAAAAHRGGRFYFLAGSLALILPATPLYLVAVWIPGINRLSTVRWVGLVHLFWLLAAAYGFEMWLRSPRGRAVHRAYLVVLSLAAVGGGQWISKWNHGWQAALRADTLRLPDRTVYLDDATFLQAVKSGFDACYSLGNPNFLLPLVGLVLLGKALQAPRKWAPAVLALTLLELWTFSYRFNPRERSENLYAPTPVTDFLVRHAGADRIAGLSTIKPNTLLPFSLKDAGGYDSFYPRSSGRYMAALLFGDAAQAASPGQVLIGSDASLPLLDHLSVRYLVGLPGGAPLSLPRVGETVLPIYENVSRLPRAALYQETRLVQEETARLRELLDPAFPRRDVALVEEPVALEEIAPGQTRIVREGTNFVDLECDVAGRSLLVLNDAWCRGWEVQVEGQPRPMLRVNQMFRGVVLEAGDRHVLFRFRPPAWDLALGSFFLALALSVVMLIWGARTAPTDR